MSSRSETGHIKNLANFSKLISSATALGESYNPSNGTITIEAFNTIKSEASAAIDAVNNLKASIDIAIAERQKVFAPLSKFITRLFGALKASQPSEQILNNASTIIRKLQGRRATAKLTEEELKTLQADGKEVKQISSSQLSFDSRIGNFSKLVTLFASVTEYKPNETEFQITTLNTRLEELKTKNQMVIEAETLLSNALMERNKILYAEGDGLVESALIAKQYIKSLFGTGSPQYKQVSALEFKKQKI